MTEPVHLSFPEGTTHVIIHVGAAAPTPASVPSAPEALPSRHLLRNAVVALALFSGGYTVHAAMTVPPAADAAGLLPTNFPLMPAPPLSGPGSPLASPRLENPPSLRSASPVPVGAPGAAQIPASIARPAPPTSYASPPSASNGGVPSLAAPSMVAPPSAPAPAAAEKNAFGLN